MRVFKNRTFNKWANKVGLIDRALLVAVVEIQNGLFDVDLGGNVINKRVALNGTGKSGGARALLAYRTRDKAFFVYGFAKNVRSNVKTDELKSLKMLATLLLNFSEKEISVAIKNRVLVEVTNNE